MAGSVRLGTGVLRALPEGLECELDLDGDGLAVSFAFEIASDVAGDGRDDEEAFELHQDLADLVRLDGGLDDSDLD